MALALGLLTATVGVTVGAQKAEQEPSVRTYPPFNPSHLVGAEPAPPPDAASDPNAPPPAGGTWTQLASLPPVALDNCLVLTDGDTFCHQHRSGRWYRLKPSNTGSYQNGTWAFDSTMPTGYAPLYFASAVLPDGRVIVAGGEYNCNPTCVANWQAKAALYDPVTKTWVNVPPPTGWTTIGDAQALVMSNGIFMLADCCSSKMAYFNPSTLTWTNLVLSKNQVDANNNEENWVLLPSGKLLAVHASYAASQTYSEVFDPQTLGWSFAGDTKVVLTDPGSKEQGPGTLRPDGTVVFFGGANPGPAPTAIYDPTAVNLANAWTAGPSFPGLDTASDAPAAVLPNGNVLVQASPGVFDVPSSWYEFDASNTLQRVASPGYAFTPSSYEGHMLVLPTGQVLQTEFSNDVRLYNQLGTYNPAWAPVVSTAPATVAPGGTGYSLSGTQLNGMTQGGYYGDDWQSATNYPLVRITNAATGHVIYAKTYNHTSMGVQTGSLLVSTTFDVPAAAETGPSTLEVVANGIPSAPVAITVQGAGTLPGAFAKSAPANGATAQPTTVTLSWGASAGASTYEYCIDTTGDSACGTSWISTGSTTSATASGLVAGTTYYWQVRANNGAGSTLANTGSWWSFGTAVPAPGAFSKTAPANGATGIPTSTSLSWGASTNATSYSYCIDTTNDNACGTSWLGVGAATTASVTGLTPGATYFWQVRASNGGGTTEANSTTWWSFTTVAAPGAFGKTAPANGATATVGTVLSMSWGASTGATSYEFCIDIVNDNACGGTWQNMGTATSRTVRGFLLGTTYYWQVRAVNGALRTEADGGTWWSFTGGSSAPGAFAKTSPLNGTTGAGTNVTLSWAASSGAASYEYCVDTVNDNACGAAWTSTPGTGATLTGLANGTSYFWQVRAVNGNGTTLADSGAWWSFATAVAAPGNFAKSAPANGATGLATSLALSWGASAGAASYEYCVDTTNDNACGAAWTPAAGTSASLAGLANGTTYFWQVRALNGGGTTLADSGAWWSFATAAAASGPGAFNKVAPADGALVTTVGRVSLSWTASAGATSYQFCIDTVNDNACNGSWANMGTATSRFIADVGAGRTYYWQVRAVNATGTTLADGGAWWSLTGAPPQTAEPR